jgi:hydrogenase maturation protease
MDPVAQIARAVLYEGYLLWPYRRSALKNQHRFTIGGIYPRSYAERYRDRAAAGFTCLVEGEDVRLDVELRFLHVVRRQASLRGHAVDEIVVSGERYLSWDEATERRVRAAALAGSAAIPIAVSAGEERESLAGDAALLRRWEALFGRLDLTMKAVRDGLVRVTVEVTNATPWEGTTRDDALRRTFASAHVVLQVDGGVFVSASDPPDALREDAERCQSEGLWPVLVGDDGDRRTLLAAPVILYDYPRIAPESPGDHFDGTEIDELLVHSIRALTDDEKREMRATDPRAREILERATALTPEQLARLHGTFRDARTAER